MRRTFIKKEGVVITTLARYLLGEKCGNRLKTIDELATECRSSVGLTQAALKTLESSGAIRIERRGRNGSYLVEMDNKALLKSIAESCGYQQRGMCDAFALYPLVRRFSERIESPV